MKIVNGNKIADKILDKLKEEVSDIKPIIKLGVILVGHNPVSLSFVKKKEEAANKLGIKFKLWRFSESISNRALRKTISQISARKDVHGIIIQLPLPSHLNTQYILDSIPPDKDIDVLSSRLLGKFYTGKSKILPPVVGAVLQIFKQYDIKVASQVITIVGAGRLVGKPLAIEFMRHNATVIIINDKTASLKDYTLMADVLISGVGKAGLIKSGMIKKGALVIDAGLSREKGMKNLWGDIAIQGIEKKARIFVPAKGGLGPITVAMVMENLVKGIRL